MFFSSLFGAVVACAVPFVTKHIVLLKVGCLLIYPFLIRTCKRIGEYSLTLSIFSIVTIVMGGMMYGIKLCMKDYVNRNSVVVVVSVFCIAAFCVVITLSEITKKWRKESLKNQNLIKVSISDGRKERAFNAFYDSGNRVYAKNGEPVTIVNYNIYNSFDGREENLYISTINGISVLKAKEVKIKIYSDISDNMIYHMKIASSPTINVREGVLLHADMFGG